MSRRARVRVSSAPLAVKNREHGFTPCSCRGEEIALLPPLVSPGIPRGTCARRTDLLHTSVSFASFFLTVPCKEHVSIAYRCSSHGHDTRCTAACIRTVHAPPIHDPGILYEPPKIRVLRTLRKVCLRLRSSYVTSFPAGPIKKHGSCFASTTPRKVSPALR